MDRHIERVLGERDVALGEFLGHALQQHALTDRTGGVLQRRGGEDVAELGARLLEADGADVGDVVAHDGQFGGRGVEARE